MIENDIKKDLSRITGLDAFPLQLPSKQLEGVIYQRISDPKVFTGLAKTTLVQARYQITVQLLNDYEKALWLSEKIKEEWGKIEHGYLGDYPVQHVERGNLIQDREELTENRTCYRITRDFILTYAEDAK
ncbi:hypothetical protein QE197_12425 [Arsenophonus nasoniae]|uniref:Uncharacterized protein n=1 Tax=Arsenophonus nasoniae TaxID=638 RepID=A0A4P7KW82_9GAMM|nr:hypothetical protein [Arsenophonus nasoniae]QBY44204.1 hypothetical protein ArsFIN_27810 [Arsenophonus nasoniae]QBY44281.1 hypothetical protein ArsFIN_28650 [Arsenophonus nasoniae]WGM04500.1 hypothetical protein QE258_12785 [Arsenophonus nasoniae]WGM04559.1 hypothetical protein QE258_13160 [Arsenophonus nasoniae]WGM07535.1 hypothetical protein QE258_10000 [Arsenophonus nasoniae]